jgi:hypothetical protein
VRTWLFVGIALLPSTLSAITATPFVEGWGKDDNNVSVLNPYLAAYVITCPWLASSLPNSASGDNVGWDYNDPTKWSFRFATNVPGQSTVGSGTVQSFYYSAWVVNNDGYTLPNGNAANTYDITGDIGGANYTLNYVPGANDPGGSSSATALANVHFFQFVRTISTFQDEPNGVPSTVTRYFVDNKGSLTTPFYDQVFASGYAGPGNSQKWMDDTPYRCENQSGTGTCNDDGPPTLVSIDWEAQVFVAVNLGANATLGTQNDVILYGGRWWGFTYTNADVPEPGFGLLSGLGVIAMALARRRKGLPGRLG